MTRVAIFDYQITARNPIGSCHLQVLKALSDEIAFTVFAVDFENPNPGKIDWIRISVPRRPLALLFLAYHIVAPIAFLWHRWRRGVRFDLIQTVESKSWPPGDVVYSHFCH